MANKLKDLASLFVISVFVFVFVFFHRCIHVAFIIV